MVHARLFRFWSIGPSGFQTFLDFGTSSYNNVYYFSKLRLNLDKSGYQHTDFGYSLYEEESYKKIQFLYFTKSRELPSCLYHYSQCPKTERRFSDDAEN